MDKGANIQRLDETDIVIGIDPSASYRDTTIEVHDGDLVFLYTDGITDELDERDEPYGEQKLIEELRRSHEADLEKIINNVHEGVLQHTGGKPQDDLTALAVKIVSLAPCRKPTPGLSKKSV
jgi:serine phosphatase RsbU (regulator of sigma subunit)